MNAEQSMNAEQRTPSRIGPHGETTLDSLRALDSAMEARLGALLTRRYGVHALPDAPPSEGRERPLRVRVAGLLILAAYTPVAVHRDGWMPRVPETFRDPDGPGDRAACRNERLLTRLIVRGLIRRGEWQQEVARQPVSPEHRVSFEEAIARHNRAHPESTLHILSAEETREAWERVERGEMTVTWEDGQADCPHCHRGYWPGAGRCPHCERIIG